MEFKSAYPDFPGLVKRASICEVSDDDVPQGADGINCERYTYGQLRRTPIIPEVMERVVNSQLKQYALECNERNRCNGFQMYKVNGEYCFWGLRVGPVIKAPTLDSLKEILKEDSKTAVALDNGEVTSDMIRAISYRLLRQEIGKQCNLSERDAGFAIGRQLDAVPHEDESGYIYMVPNWAHKWFKHNGYASMMANELNR